MTTDNTRRLPNSASGRTPSQEAYFQAAVEWFHYSIWTIDEAANLLAGCLPKRQMFQPGTSNESTDQRVLKVENQIRRELGRSFEAESSKKYFAPIEINQAALMSWAEQSIELPPSLKLAYQHHLRDVESSVYTTPCLEAISWTIERYWKNADLRNPATEGEIIQAILQEFDELSYEDCLAVERVCRHPFTLS